MPAYVSSSSSVRTLPLTPNHHNQMPNPKPSSTPNAETKSEPSNRPFMCEEQPQSPHFAGELHYSHYLTWKRTHT